MDDMSISYGKLNHCFSLEPDIVVPSGVTIIGDEAFAYKDTVKSVVLPEGVTEIQEKAFYYTSFDDVSESHIETVVLPESLEEIGYRAFYNCKNLKNLKIPDGVTSIGEAAFAGCNSLGDSEGFFIHNNVLYNYGGPAGEVHIPEGVIKIDEGAFELTYELERLDVTIPRSVKFLLAPAFSGTGITSVVLLGDYKQIEPGVFRKCSFLQKVTLPDTVEIIGMDAFEDCSDLDRINLPAGLRRIEERAFYHCAFTSIEIPEGVEYISKSAFGDCKYLEEVTIPASVNSLGWHAFDGCNSLRKITIEDINKLEDSVKPYAAVAFVDSRESLDTFRGKTHMAYIKDNVAGLAEVAVEHPVLVDFLLEHRLIERRHVPEFLKYIDKADNVALRVRLIDYEVNVLSGDDDDDLKGMLGIE